MLRMDNVKKFIENMLKGNASAPILSREEAIQFLKTDSEAFSKFENAYQKEILAKPDRNQLFGVSAKQMKEMNDSLTTPNELSDLVSRIVNELVAQTTVWEYKKGTFTESAGSVLGIAEKSAVSLEELQGIPTQYRPQLAGDVCLRTTPDKLPAYQELLYWYKKSLEEETSDRDRRFAYGQFRKGLDLLDLDEITYQIIGMNQTSMGYWLPKISGAVESEGFFKIPGTKILKVPLPVLQLTFVDSYNDLTRTTLDIVDQFCMKALRLDTDGDYFLKTGVFSSKFDFRNARVHDPKEVREIGEYFLYVHHLSRSLGFMTYGAATTNEWVVRDFIPDVEENLMIYHGMPLHTEYRVFVDFDTKEVLGIHPYWDPDVMKKHFGDAKKSDDPDAYHDYITYSLNEDKLMGRYEKNKDVVARHVQDILSGDIETNMSGQWSMDIMQNGSDFWFIDMAPASMSAFHECIPAGKLKTADQNWLPVLK